MTKTKTTLLILAVTLALILAQLLFCVKNLSAGPLEQLTGMNREMVMDKIAAQVVAALPDDIHMRLLAIGPVEGDEDGAFVRTLTAQIKEKTKYRLIERQDLDKLLTEQGVQLSPLTDDVKAVEPGKIKGVEGLVMARITSASHSFFNASAQVFVKMDNVETGDIVFARNFSAHQTSPVMRNVALAILLVLLFNRFIRMIRRRKQRNRERQVTDDDTAQLEITTNLKRCRDNLTRAHDMLVDQDRTDLSVPVADAAREVKQLILDISQAPGLNPDLLDSRDRRATNQTLKKTAQVTASLKNLSKNLAAESERLYAETGNGKLDKVPGLVRTVNQEIKNCANRFLDRDSGQVS